MSRSGYRDDHDNDWALIRWRGAVQSAIRGARGQAFLREMQAALDALPEKRLAAGSLRTPTGEVCALGAVAAARGMDVSAFAKADEYDDESWDGVGPAFGIADAMAREIMFWNDDGGPYDLTPEGRFHMMRCWVERHIAAGGEIRRKA